MDYADYVFTNPISPSSLYDTFRYIERETPTRAARDGRADSDALSH